MDRRIRGAPLPTGDTQPQYSIIGVRQGEDLRVLLLGDEFLGLDHHWVTDTMYPQGRSRLCTHCEGDCPLHGRYRLVWLGYIACLEMPQKQRSILRIGAETAKGILQLLGRSVTLRGAHLLLRHVHDATRSKAGAEVLHEIYDGGLPRAHPIEPTLCNLLGVKALPDYGPTAADVADRLAAQEASSQ